MRGVMLGAGGQLVVPESESRVIMQVIREVETVLRTGRLDEAEHHKLDSALDKLKALGHQVSRGYHRNPLTLLANPPIAARRRAFGQGGKLFLAGDVVGQIAADVHSIHYLHAEDGKPYVHDFENGGAEAWAVLRGDKHDVLLTHKRGLPLWEDI